MWWQLELVADVIAALSSVRDVNGEDQSLVAEPLYTVHDLFRQLPIPVHVKLEPPVTVWCCCHNLLH